ncbi:MAG: ScaI family restriction endonuclease [Caulobacter sp.]|nr:ScaI family restriction endonuclease [Caulobacter sp.]
MPSPYLNVPPDQWRATTESLLDAHPLDRDELVEIVLSSWNAIFESRLAGKFEIGSDIFPKPQIMGFLLHELVPLELASRYPNSWRPEKDKKDKDIVYIPDTSFSVEIKTSSSPGSIFGNRSYAQEMVGEGKSKDGYYLAINFGKFSGNRRPEIARIRFGWLDHTDWLAQKAATGQQARLSPAVELTKLLLLYGR